MGSEFGIWRNLPSRRWPSPASPHRL